MKSSKITIDDRRKGLTAVFGDKDDAPDIGGCNFITGEYNRGAGGLIGYSTSDPALWESFWRVVGTAEPAPLPRGAMAIMMAQYSPADPVELEPENITRDNSGITVQWKRIHTAQPGDAEGTRPSRFAVLILPDAKQTQIYRDVFLAAEQEKAAAQLAEDVKIFTDGSKERIGVMPVTKLKRKMEFFGF